MWQMDGVSIIVAELIDSLLDFVVFLGGTGFSDKAFEPMARSADSGDIEDVVTHSSAPCFRLS
jgi:hypothetical protein